MNNDKPVVAIQLPEEIHEINRIINNIIILNIEKNIQVAINEERYEDVIELTEQLNQRKSSINKKN